MKVPTTAICVITAGAFLSVGACTNGGKNKRSDTTGFTAGSAAGQVSPAPLPTPLDSAKDTASHKAKAPPL